MSAECKYDSCEAEDKDLKATEEPLLVNLPM